MTEDEAWQAGRGIWKFNADRALAQDEVQIVNTEGLVLAVATITGISKHGDRYALEGELLRGDARVGKPTTTPPPVTQLRRLLLTSRFPHSGLKELHGLPIHHP
ncbi:hypothetical protein [Streptomyces sp. SP2-10]|uniref:hypothetical protein n=1 Tax=Streptomyces sp. SP2-10 TaxID=2873385 RepID=UPI001CA63C8E|nr:hypothetical protein [Streptomyces sp. SP2-10]MBY8844614.1 hypothetical protein [Streptomyces sp. SP2-10]